MSSSAPQAEPTNRARQGGKEGLSRSGLQLEQPSLLAATSGSTPSRARIWDRSDHSRSTAVKRNRVGELHLQHKYEHSKASSHTHAPTSEQAQQHPLPPLDYIGPDTQHRTHFQTRAQTPLKQTANNAPTHYNKHTLHRTATPKIKFKSSNKTPHSSTHNRLPHHPIASCYNHKPYPNT